METVKRLPILKIGVKNHNGRVYTASNVQEIIENFEEGINTLLISTL